MYPNPIGKTLDRITASKRYKTRLQERIRRSKVVDDTTFELDDSDEEEEEEENVVINWQTDAGEYAERIWQWWKPHMKTFPVHGLVLCLIVLAQLSSCSVEKVFSKLKSIRDRCEESMYDDMCEVWLFLQCNGDLDDLYAAMSEKDLEGCFLFVLH